MLCRVGRIDPVHGLPCEFPPRGCWSRHTHEDVYPSLWNCAFERYSRLHLLPELTTDQPISSWASCMALARHGFNLPQSGLVQRSPRVEDLHQFHYCVNHLLTTTQVQRSIQHPSALPMSPPADCRPPQSPPTAPD